MKTKKILSLVLAMVMAFALAIPAFAATTVAAGVRYMYDASTATVAVADTNSDSTDDEWSITIDGTKGVLTTQTSTDGATATVAEIAEWAAAVSYTNWTLTTDGTKVIFTAGTGANADDLPTGSTVADTALGSLADLDGEGAKVEIGSETRVPQINVIIPKTGSAVLNPYKMSVTAAGATNNNQIISAPQYIKSTSDVPLKVSVKAVAAPSANVTMATKSVTDKTTDKQVYMYLNTAVTNNSATAPTNPTFPAFNKATAAVLATGEGGVLSNVELGAATTAGSASYLAFRLEGDMTPAPTTAWAEADKVDVTLTFTFVASALTPPAATPAG